ncbi:MAG: JAB domain-containing protein [Chitinophagaceae bacterium]|nr:JAB domain-containing protein [Chitinophagaceae bacterium]MCA6511572.1 JAB domain-containing protein [Chitinophagaceae bacterium]
MFNNVAEIEVVYKPAISDKPIISSSLDAYNVLVKFFPIETLSLQERFVALYLNRSNRVIGVYPMSVGGITGTVVDVRLLLSVALKTAATGIILAHNHPSGNLKPSEADKELTNKIKKASEYMDIKLLDHLIIAPEGRYLSFTEEGHL